MSETVEQRAVAWLAGHDTGSSSKTIACHMLGLDHAGPFGPSEPSDGSDLGRCLRLLRLIPEWVPRMGEMSELSNAWRALIPHWDELATILAGEIGDDLPQRGSAPKTYARMKEITNEARKADGWINLGGMSIQMGRSTP